jgi:S1-C subfamily serine protease
MIVPIDILEPILEDMTRTGRANRPPRPWLGMYATEAGERLVVAGLAPGAPAERAGIRVGDAVMAVGGEKPKSLADLWRKVWAQGACGAVVPLKLARGGKIVEARLTSADRADFLKKPHLH